jgi:hypothetical protein
MFGMRKTVLDFEFFPVARAPVVNQYCRLVVEKEHQLDEDAAFPMSQQLMDSCGEMLNEVVQVVAVRRLQHEGQGAVVAVHATGENGGKFVWNHDALRLTTCTSDPSFEGAVMENVYEPLFALTVNQGVYLGPNDVGDLMRYNHLYCDETIDYHAYVNGLPSNNSLRSPACQ